MNNHLFYREKFLLNSGFTLRIPKVRDMADPTSKYSQRLSILLVDEPEMDSYDFLLRALVDENWEKDIVDALKWSKRPLYTAMYN